MRGLTPVSMRGGVRGLSPHLEARAMGVQHKFGRLPSQNLIPQPPCHACLPMHSTQHDQPSWNHSTSRILDPGIISL